MRHQGSQPERRLVRKGQEKPGEDGLLKDLVMKDDWRRHTMGHLNRDNIPFMIILGVATLLFLSLLTPFFFSLFWAAVIAGIFRPLYRRINRRLNRPNLSTVAVFIAIALIILLPAGVVGSSSSMGS
jgi:predicted PurR-regulated permease PerM